MEYNDLGLRCRSRSCGSRQEKKWVIPSQLSKGLHVLSGVGGREGRRQISRGLRASGDAITISKKPGVPLSREYTHHLDPQLQQTLGLCTQIRSRAGERRGRWRGRLWIFPLQFFLSKGAFVSGPGMAFQARVNGTLHTSRPSPFILIILIPLSKMVPRCINRPPLGLFQSNHTNYLLSWP